MTGPSDYLAAERTFLAWIRTGLALMGFGFVVARFGIYIQALAGHGGQLKEGVDLGRPARLGLVVAALLAALGIAMVAGLLFFSHETDSMSTDSGIVMVQSHRSVDQTVDTIQGLLKAKGIKLFALVDHSGEAKAAGLEMRPTKLLIFGSPKADTPLMVAAPSVALDLPLKLLVSEDANGQVWISYNSPAYLQARHGLPKELVGVLAGAEMLAKGAE